MQCHKRRGSLSVCIKDETEKMALGSGGVEGRERVSRGREGGYVCVCVCVWRFSCQTHKHKPGWSPQWQY